MQIISLPLKHFSESEYWVLILFITFVILLYLYSLLVFINVDFLSESNIYIYVLITAIASPLVGSFIGVMHKRSMLKRNLAANEKESSSEEFKNI